MKRQFTSGSGLHGFTREDGTWQCTGAAMGRRNDPGTTEALPGTLHVRRIKLDSGGYDQEGAYWGIGLPLWQLRGEEVSSFTRATTREIAIIHFRNIYPNCKIK